MAHHRVHPASPAARDTLVLGIVGGSGLYGMDTVRVIEQVTVDTPFGQPSAPFIVGELPRTEGPHLRVVFLPRHGIGHTLMPSEINYRANVFGFKQLGVTHLVGISAVGSLREDIEPGHVVLVDQFIDRTWGRASTFFGDGIVAHVQFGEPTCPRLRTRLGFVAEEDGARVHPRGTCVVMEGPAFSSRAESQLYRGWGADVVGMTALPEAKLAREAELAYALVAFATDYDCWHRTEAEVSVAEVVEVLRQNVSRAQRIVRELAAALPTSVRSMPYPAAVEHALITAADQISAAARERLDLIVGHYLETQQL